MYKAAQLYPAVI